MLEALKSFFNLLTALYGIIRLIQSIYRLIKEKRNHTGRLKMINSHSTDSPVLQWLFIMQENYAYNICEKAIWTDLWVAIIITSLYFHLL